MKSGKNDKKSSFFSQSYSKCLISEIFFVFNLARMFAAHHEKSFVPFF